MSGPALIHVVVSGLATGCIYALVALSLVIVYNATRTVNFSQGEMLMVSAFTAWSAQHAGLPLPLALVAGIAAGGLLALLTEPALAPAREHLRLDPASRVLVVNTEGATDPAGYARIVRGET